MAQQQTPERIVLYGTDEAEEKRRVSCAGTCLEPSLGAIASVTRDA